MVPGLLVRDGKGSPEDPSRGEDPLTAARKLAAGREVSLRILVPEGSQANVGPLAAAFEQGTGVKVTLRATSVGEVASIALLETLAKRVGFDLALPPTFSVADLVEGGALLDLTDLSRKYEPASEGSGALYSLGDRYKGRFYGFQTDGDVYLMFYHRALVEESGLAEAYADRHGQPMGVPTTWEELDRQMEFCHDPDKGRFGGALFRIPGFLEWEWWIRLHAKGCKPVDEDMRPRFQEPEALAALEELIAASAWQSPGAATQGLVGNWEDFARGHCYANIGWGGTQKFLQGPGSRVKDRLTFGPTPGGMVDGRPRPVSYFNWGWNYVVAKDTPEPDLAYLFALYARQPEPSTVSVSAREGFFDPFRETHYSDPRVIGVYGQDFLAQHRASLSSCVPDFYLQGRDEYFGVLARNLDRANRGEITPERALLLATRDWDLITERLGREGQVQQWREVSRNYPPDWSDSGR